VDREQLGLGFSVPDEHSPSVARVAKGSRAALRLLERGGHLSTVGVVPQHVVWLAPAHHPLGQVVPEILADVHLLAPLHSGDERLRAAIHGLVPSRRLWTEDS
jgi:hypothetical protein